MSLKMIMLLFFVALSLNTDLSSVCANNIHQKEMDLMTEQNLRKLLVDVHKQPKPVSGGNDDPVVSKVLEPYKIRS